MSGISPTMTYKTVDDVLACLQKQYSMIAAAMDKAELFETSPDAAAAVTALRNDERRIAETLGEIVADSGSSGAELGDHTWLQFVPSEQVHALAIELRKLCESDGSLQDIERSKMEFDGAVQEFVETIAYQVNTPMVRERLELLAEFFASRACQES